MSGFLNDLRYALRGLQRSPALSFVLVLTLGLGIGANTALFSVVKSVLLSPLPYQDPDNVVMLWSRWKDFPERTWVSAPEYQNYTQVIKRIAKLALIQGSEVSITDGDQPLRVQSYSVTPNLFGTVGVDAQSGRVFTDQDAMLDGNSNVVLISNELWKSRFGSQAVVGSTMQVNGTAQTIIGVLPEGFKLPLDYRTATPAHLYFPLALQPFSGQLPQLGGSHGFYVIGRLAAGATAGSANAELKQLTDRLTREGTYPQDWNFGAFVVSAPDEVAGKMKPALLVLLGAVAFVLLIACANVANLLLVRAEDRRREVSVRAALGANRQRLVRQFLTENVLLSLVGAAFGLLLAFLGVRGLMALAPATLPRLPEVSIDGSVLGFTALLAVLTSILFGLLPALQGSRVELQETLKEGGRANTSGTRRTRVRQTLVVSEIALAVVLVVGAGLLLRSFGRLLGIDPGFEASHVLTMRMSPPAAFYPQPADVNGFYQRLLDEVRRLPGVQQAGMIRVLPIDSDIGDAGVQVEGYVSPEGALYNPADWQAASDGYFEAMGMKLVSGRFFNAGDRLESEQVIIVNESFVKKYFAGGNALDRRVRFAFRDSVPWQRVVGVVKNVKHNGLTGEVKATFYRPQQQWPVSTGNAARGMTLVVRAEGDPQALSAPVRRVIAGLDPRMPQSRVQTMNEVMSTAVAQPRFTMMLLIVFGGLALSLALVGIYGVVSYVVAQRRQEMGIRMALGAEPRTVVWLALRTGLVQTLSGIAIGVIAASLLTRVLSGMLFDTNTHDPLTYGAVTLLALAATAAASWIPARRAAQSDPLKSLRSE